MGKGPITVIYLLVMVAVIVAMDFMFLRHRFWQRLIANIGVVVVFVTFYLIFLKR